MWHIFILFQSIWSKVLTLGYTQILYGIELRLWCYEHGKGGIFGLQ